MLFEFDSDQRLWQDTVRDGRLPRNAHPRWSGRRRRRCGSGPAVAGLRRPRLDRADRPRPSAVELAIVLEELGRATDPTPYLATMTQFAPLAPGSIRPEQSGTAVFDGVSARRDGAGWLLNGTAQHVLDGDRADWFAVVTGAGVFAGSRRPRCRRPAARSSIRCCTSPRSTSRGCGSTSSDRSDGEPERARSSPCTGLALTMVGACQRILDLALEHVRDPAAVRRADRLVPSRQAQGRRHARGDRTGPRPGLFRGADHRRGRSAPPGGRVDGQGRGGGVPVPGVPPRPPAVRRPWASPGRTTFSSRSSGPRPASCCSAARPSTGR